MPVVNLGGVESSPGNYTLFLELGGRGLDTALSYGTATQEKVGAAIASGVVPRDEIFVTTKIMCCPASQAFYTGCSDPSMQGLTPMQRVDRDLRELGVDQVDLILLHWPCDNASDTLAHYLELEKALQAGKARAIGVSNFNVTDLENLTNGGATVTPAVNQCAMSIGLHDDATIDYCIKNDIVYEAWSPLGGISHIDVLNDPDVVRIAAENNVSAAQVALRWIVQRNASFVTAGTNATYLQEDLDIFHFKLTDAEMELLSAK